MRPHRPPASQRRTATSLAGSVSRSSTHTSTGPGTTLRTPGVASRRPHVATRTRPSPGEAFDREHDLSGGGEGVAAAEVQRARVPAWFGGTDDDEVDGDAAGDGGDDGEVVAAAGRAPAPAPRGAPRTRRRQAGAQRAAASAVGIAAGLRLSAGRPG